MPINLKYHKKGDVQTLDRNALAHRWLRVHIEMSMIRMRTEFELNLLIDYVIEEMQAMASTEMALSRYRSDDAIDALRIAFDYIQI